MSDAWPTPQHDTTGRYWRFDPCGECDDPDCAEGNSVDVTGDIAAMRADRDELQQAYDALMHIVEQQKRGMDELNDKWHRTLDREAVLTERLAATTVERDELRLALRESQHMNTELRAERDGLLNGNRDLHEECQRLRRERDRYRRAWMRQRVRRDRAAQALNGGDDEPKNETPKVTTQGTLTVRVEVPQVDMGSHESGAQYRAPNGGDDE